MRWLPTQETAEKLPKAWRGEILSPSSRSTWRSRARRGPESGEPLPSLPRLGREMVESLEGCLFISRMVAIPYRTLWNEICRPNLASLCTQLSFQQTVVFVVKPVNSPILSPFISFYSNLNLFIIPFFQYVQKEAKCMTDTLSFSF